jgi:crotonobetainyl-CoA:carnitine CoA-transferase CaiB-like acyl-CoA transferase
MCAAAQSLSGVRVIDLSQIYQGPYASFLMAMAGADVIKVEPPAGERLRGGPGRPLNMAFAMLNSNKRSVTLDLKKSRGRELLLELAKLADVVLENYAPGVMERLGVGAQRLRDANPRLIYASGTGFGLSGPDRDQLAMDHTVQAMGGMMSVTGERGGPPLRAGGAVADILGGVHLYGAIVTALFERERSGRGQLVEVSMQESMYFTFASAYTNYHHTRRTPGPSGNGPLGAPSAPYNVYATRDGYLAIICVTEEHWQRLLREMGHDELLDDPRFADRTARARHAAEVDALVGSWAASLTRDEAYRATRRARVPAAAVRDLVEVMEDPHMHERGMLQWFDHRELGRVVLPHSPLGFPETPREPLRASPSTGEHNREVYGRWLGLSDAELDALEGEGVI